MREEYDFSKGIRGKYAGRVVTTSTRTTAWEHPSVKLLAKHGRDPIEAITEQARGIVLAALDAGAIQTGKRFGVGVEMPQPELRNRIGDERENLIGVFDPLRSFVGCLQRCTNPNADGT